MTPEPNRGKRNDSSNLVYVIRELAFLKGITENEARKAVWENGTQIYKIKVEGQ